VEPASTGSGHSQGIQNDRILAEIAFVDVLVNKRKVLLHDPARAENHVAHLGVAHLAVGKPHV